MEVTSIATSTSITFLYNICEHYIFLKFLVYDSEFRVNDEYFDSDVFELVTALQALVTYR